MNKHLKRFEAGIMPFGILLSLAIIYFLILAVLDLVHAHQNKAIVSFILKTVLALSSIYFVGFSVEKSYKKINSN